MFLMRILSTSISKRFCRSKYEQELTLLFFFNSSWEATMKYRIQEYVDGNGYKVFRPQYKGWFFWSYWWRNEDEESGWNFNEDVIVEFPNIQQAQTYIDGMEKSRIAESKTRFVLVKNHTYS